MTPAPPRVRGRRRPLQSATNQRRAAADSGAHARARRRGRPPTPVAEAEHIACSIAGARLGAHPRRRTSVHARAARPASPTSSRRFRRASTGTVVPKLPASAAAARSARDHRRELAHAATLELHAATRRARDRLYGQTAAMRRSLIGASARCGASSVPARLVHEEDVSPSLDRHDRRVGQSIAGRKSDECDAHEADPTGSEEVSEEPVRE